CLYRVTRPEATTKVGFGWPSAISRQLLNQDREHAFDFDGLLRQLVVVVGRESGRVDGVALPGPLDLAFRIFAECSVDGHSNGPDCVFRRVRRQTSTAYRPLAEQTQRT